jgi:thermitase
VKKKMEMNKRHSFQMGTIVVLLLAAFSLSAAASPRSPSRKPENPASQTIPSQHVIIKVDRQSEGLSTLSTAFHQTMNHFGAQSPVSLFDPRYGDVELKEDLGLSRIYVVAIADAADLEEAVAAFAEVPEVEYAEPDAIGYGAWMPNDPRLEDQWNLHSTGQMDSTPDADVDAPEAWEISRGSTSTVLAVIDTGIDLDHPDLAGQIVEGYNFITETIPPQDDNGHGTHVAGIAAAATNNTIGIAGVCPRCRVMPLKALDSNNRGYYSDWASAIEYAVDNGAHVINMSLGGDIDSSMLHTAIRYAYQSNVPIVVSMMNEGNSRPYYPAVYTETVAVGATDRHDARWVASSFGDHIDLVAPGKSVLSTYWDDGYTYMLGTSMAAPHVAGTLGLIHAVHPHYTVEELRHIVRTTADDQVGPPNEDKKGWDIYFGAGRLNLARAVQHAVPPDAVSIDGPTEGLVGTERTFIANVHPITAAQPITYVWQATAQTPITHTGGLSDDFTCTWDVIGPQQVTLTVANTGGIVTVTHTITITELSPGQDVTVCNGHTCTFDTLQAAVDAVEASNTIKVAAGTYTSIGDADQVVYIDKSITMRGGYSSAFTEPPDPKANPTIIDAQSESRAVYITGESAGYPISPTIEGMWVTGGDASGLPGGSVGGGFYAVEAHPTISDSHIVSNTARWGGGIYLNGSSGTLCGNTIAHNTVEQDGGGIYLHRSETVVEGSTIAYNHAGKGGGGLYAYWSDASINHNLIKANSADNDGGGLYLWKSDLNLARNVIIDNQAQAGGGGYLAYEEAQWTNNVIASNQASAEGDGLYVQNASPRLLHTTFARNGDEGLRVTGSDVSGTVALTNTILAEHDVGVFATAGNTVMLEATLWGNNASDWDGAGQVITSAETNNHWGTPAFVAPAEGDYHIHPESPAVDAGLDIGILDDMDADLRPTGDGYDLGADELKVGLRLSQRASRNPVLSGKLLTFTLGVTNLGALEMETIITTVPSAHIRPHDPRTWNASLGPDEVWSTPLVVTAAANYTGPLTNVVQVEGTEGITDSSTITVTAVVADGLTSLKPTTSTEIILDSESTSIIFTVPPGALSEPADLAYGSLMTITNLPSDLIFAGRAFELNAYRDGTLREDFQFDKPLTVTLGYPQAALKGADGSTLRLYYWTGDRWATEGITVVTHHPAQRSLTANIDHLSTFALFAREERQVSRAIYLPLVLRRR